MVYKSRSDSRRVRPHLGGKTRRCVSRERLSGKYKLPRSGSYIGRATVNSYVSTSIPDCTCMSYLSVSGAFKKHNNTVQRIS